MTKKNFFTLIFSLFTIMFIWIFIVLYFDPFQQFRITKFHSGEERIINAGLAKNAKFDTLILGSSTSQNILKKDVDTLFNANSLNLSLSGTTNYEQRKLLELVLKTQNIKSVIYGLDPFVYNRGFNSSRVPLEKFAYENSLFNYYKYIYNISSFVDIIRGIRNKSNLNWINKNGYWGDNFIYSKENTLSHDINTQWGAQNVTAINIFKEGYSFSLMKQNFDAFFKLIENSPQIKYYIYFPPYAYLWWEYAENCNCSSNILAFKNYVIDKTSTLENVFIFDFQDNKNITENLNNYKDIVHFSPIVSKMIVEEIKNNI